MSYPEIKEEGMGIHAAFSAKESPRPATVCNIAEQVIFSRRKQEVPRELLLGLLTNEVREIGLDHISRKPGTRRTSAEQLKYLDRLQFIAMACVRLIEEDK